MKLTFLQRAVGAVKNLFKREKEINSIPQPDKVETKRSGPPMNISMAGSDKRFSLTPHGLKVKAKNRVRNRIASHSRAINAKG